ncbi:MAG TPA: MATE family efflux transporter, partial [Vineibacter sp.]|nr:MATE family efflux transporter [Vineibacter sp.]
LAYSDVLFGGVAAIWLANTLLSVVRGTGNMAVPMVIMLSAAAAQVVLGWALTQGAGPLPALGLAGIGWANILGQVLAVIATVTFLFSPASRVQPALRGVRPSWPMFRDILRVGGVAIFFSLQNAFAIIAVSAMIGGFGAAVVAGYGIGARLELLQIQIVFGFGAALVPMVGLNIGAGQAERARRIALVGALLAGVASGVIGGGFALAPDAWSGLYTTDAAVREAAAQYLQRVGPAYAFFGFGVCLYFATQGSGRILGPVLVATARLGVVLAGAALVLAAGGGFAAVCWAITGAMVAYGLLAGAMLAFGRWGPARR